MKQKNKLYAVILFFLLAMIPQIIAEVTQSQTQPVPEEKGEDRWTNIEQIQPTDMMDNPTKTIENWDKLSPDQRENLYKHPGALMKQEFLEKFIAEKKIGKINVGTDDSISYDGTNLVTNKGASCLVSSLEGASNVEIREGVITVSFPEGTDLSTRSFSDGLKITGTNIILNTGHLNAGSLTFISGGVQLEPETIYNDNQNQIKIKTFDQPIKLCNAGASCGEPAISFNGNNMAISGDNLEVELKQKKSIDTIQIKGDITLVNGGRTLIFDKKGKAEIIIDKENQFGKPTVPNIEVINENEEERTRYLFEEEAEGQIRIGCPDESNIQGQVTGAGTCTILQAKNENLKANLMFSREGLELHMKGELGWMVKMAIQGKLESYLTEANIQLTPEIKRGIKDLSEALKSSGSGDSYKFNVATGTITGSKITQPIQVSPSVLSALVERLKDNTNPKCVG